MIEQGTVTIPWNSGLAEMDIDEYIGGEVTITDTEPPVSLKITDAKPVHELGKTGRIALTLERQA